MMHPANKNLRAGNRHFRTGFLILAGAMVLAADANADCSDSLSPDRPGFSTGTSVLSPGCEEIEFGIQATHDDSPSMHDITAPLLLYRAGVGQRWEWRAAWDGMSRTTNGSSHELASNDSNVGIKYRAFAGPKWALSILGAVSLPTGSRALTSDGYDPSLGVLWNLALDENDSLSGTVQTASLSESGHRVEENSVAIDFSRAFTTHWGGFVELFAVRDAGAPVQHTFDAGMTYLVNDNLQFDVNAGVGLNDSADNDFVGTGVAWRF